MVPNTVEASYPSLLEGFQTAAGEGHRQVIVCSAHNDLTVRPSDAILQLLDKDVAGVAIVPSVEPLAVIPNSSDLETGGSPLSFVIAG